MAVNRSVTELVERVKAGELDAETAIVQHFWQTARRAAYTQLSARVRRFEDPSDIVNAALRSALSHLKKPKGAKIRTTDEVESLVLMIVGRKGRSTGRRYSAKKRDSRRLRPLTDGETEGDSKHRVPTPEELAKAEELGKRIEKIVMQEPNKLFRAIGLLAVVEKLDNKQIIESFVESGAKLVPAERTVQKGVQLAKKRVAAALKGEFGNLLPEKKKGGKKKATKPAATEAPSGTAKQAVGKKGATKGPRTGRKKTTKAAKKSSGKARKKR